MLKIATIIKDIQRMRINLRGDRFCVSAFMDECLAKIDVTLLLSLKARVGRCFG